jgi:hypothetical protein
MDINEQLQPIIKGLIDNLKVSIEGELKEQVSGEIIKKIASAEIHTNVEKQISDRLAERINGFDFDLIIKQKLDKVIEQIVAETNRSLVAAANEQVVNEVNRRIAAYDLNKTINSIVEIKLANQMQTGKFPPKSINHDSVEFDGVILSGDNVKGGIVENFGSTGIEDRATHVQMTLMDHATAFEGPVWAPSAAIKGTLRVDGDLIINGTIPTESPAFTGLVERSREEVMKSINDTLFTGFGRILTEQIKTSGIDLDIIKQGGKEVIKGSQLGYHIVDTNIQRVGFLKDLQTLGETYLSDTLYTSSKRVGINTIDPSAALAVWDEEVEITTNKRRQDVGFIGTPRRQKLILGSNSKENIILDVDGTVQIDRLSIGKTVLGSSPVVPNYAGTVGQIVLNESPTLESSIGWVCLGGTQWAKFGKIE